MHNFVAYFWKGGDFFKSHSICIHWRSNHKRAESNISTCKPRSIFKTPALIRLSRILSYTNHESGKFQRFHMQTVPTTQLTVRARSHELEEQCAWTDYYPLFCFSLGSFAGPPGKLDYLKNFHPGSQLTGLARLSYNRKVDAQIYAPTASCFYRRRLQQLAWWLSIVTLQ